MGPKQVDLLQEQPLSVKAWGKQGTLMSALSRIHHFRDLMLRHTATSHGTQLIEDHPRAENRKVEPKTDAAAMNDLLGRSITYRVAVGPRAGEKGFTLPTLPPVPEGEKADRGVFPASATFAIRRLKLLLSSSPAVDVNGVAADPERAQPSQTVLLAGHASQSGMKQSAQIPKQSDFGICA
ncbi:MAG TPA: hypothetical protein VIM81_09670 [Gammaproteobacteria bacterium]